MMKQFAHLWTAFLALTLVGCAPPPNGPDGGSDAPEEAPAETETVWVNPYPSYCFERVGQIGADGNVDEPRRGDICDMHGGGAGGLERGTGSDPRNTAVVHVSAPSLRAVGMKSFSFSLNRKSSDPKFITGVHIMDQVRVEIVDLDAKLPDRMGFGSDLSGENSLFTHTSPDAANLRAKAGGFDFTGYEIASAVLSIDTAVDVPMEESELDFARQANMVIGEQYITGTLTISLIPMGSTGRQYGPTTFEFGRTIDWGYNKGLYSGE